VEIVLLICHPRTGSLVHAMAQRAAAALRAAGHLPLVHDLYREEFDPVLTAEEMARGFSFDGKVQAYGAELVRAGGLLVAHPDWWGQPPAMLKGWIDRVLRPGVAYDIEGGDGEPARTVPLLGAKRALVLCTTDAAEPPRSIDALWREGVFAFCGIRDPAVRVFTDVRQSTHADRERWLAETEELARTTFTARGLSTGD
jgi:NAD(P)H dehydrogenase (quinone)